MRSRELVILGGGATGCIVANKVAREMRREIARGEVGITVLDKNPTSTNQAGFTFIPTGLCGQDEITRPRRSLISPRVKTVFGDGGYVSAVDIARKVVSAKNGSQYRYDLLLVSTGCEANPQSLAGLDDDFNTFYTSIDAALKLGETLKTMDKGRIVILTAGMPIPCPGAPGKFATLLDDFLRNVRGWNPADDYSINFVWPLPAVGPPEYNRLLTESFKTRRIEYTREFKTAGIDGAKAELLSADGGSIPYDLLITIPVHRSVAALTDSGLTDAKGWMAADRYSLQYTKDGQINDDIYVTGDAGPSELPKTGIGAHYQAQITAQNLIYRLRGLPDAARYRGEIGCPFVLSSNIASGKGRAYIAAWTYNNPLRPFRPTEFGWYFYRMYYHIYWDAALKGLI
jgi:sulfide:quinone oxidoreductase